MSAHVLSILSTVILSVLAMRRQFLRHFIPRWKLIPENLRKLPVVKFA